MTSDERQLKSAVSDVSVLVANPSIEPETLDTLFDVLSNQLRRQVLGHLHSEPEATTITDLVDHITSTDDGTGDDGDKQREIALVSLRHVHIPKLLEADLVTVKEGDQETVRLTPIGSAITACFWE